MEKLTEEQVRFVTKSIGTWLHVRKQNAMPGMPVYSPSVADVEHSALLCRLLGGKEALSKAPPKSYSYPDYDLAEGNVVNLIESPRELPSEFAETANEFIVVINQHMGYKWVDKDKGILQHVNGDFFKYVANTANPAVPNRGPAGTLQKVDAPQ